VDVGLRGGAVVQYEVDDFDGARWWGVARRSGAALEAAALGELRAAPRFTALDGEKYASDDIRWVRVAP
jgi:hypothetical protein